MKWLWIIFKIQFTGCLWDFLAPGMKFWWIFTKIHWNLLNKRNFQVKNLNQRLMINHRFSDTQNANFDIKKLFSVNHPSQAIKLSHSNNSTFTGNSSFSLRDIFDPPNDKFFEKYDKKRLRIVSRLPGRNNKTLINIDCFDNIHILM